MKKLFYPLVASALCMGVFTSCSDDEEVVLWDLQATTLNVVINNAAGENLLKSSTPDNLLDTKMQVVVNGETSDIHIYENETELWSGDRRNPYSRRYAPSYFGGYIVVDDDNPRIQVGEFDSEFDWTHDISVIIGGKKYDMTMSHSIKWKDGKPNTATNVSYNGTKVDQIVNPTVTITLTK